MTDEAAARRAVVDAARAMSRSGLAPGRSGNVSRRWEAGMLITPSALDYEATEPADIAFVALDGEAAGPRKPSSEWRLHAALYRARPDVGAVVHCHSEAATALACTERAIPAFHYMVAVAGGADIRCAPYASFGSEELAEACVTAMTGRRACLLANHGQVTVGADPADALALAAEVETLAAQYCRVLAIGGARILDEAQMADVLERFADYGR